MGQHPSSLDTQKHRSRHDLRVRVLKAYEDDPDSKKRKKVRLRVARVFDASGDPELQLRAARLRSCGSIFGSVWIDKADPSRSIPVNTTRCRDSLCPDCRRARGAAWSRWVGPLLSEVRSSGRVPKFITLTQRDDPNEDLVDAIARLRKSLKKFYRRVAWKSRVHSFITALEYPHNGDAWHVHVHIVADCEWWDYRDLKSEWSSVTGGVSFVVDIRQVDDDEEAERELFKYPLKVSDLSEAALVECARSTRGLRCITTGGAWCGRRSDEDLQEGPQGRVITLGALERAVVRGEGWAVEAWAALVRWRPGRRAEPAASGGRRLPAVARGSPAPLS